MNHHRLRNSLQAYSPFPSNNLNIYTGIPLSINRNCVLGVFSILALSNKTTRSRIVRQFPRLVLPDYLLRSEIREEHIRSRKVEHSGYATAVEYAYERKDWHGCGENFGGLPGQC
jgi:hypothetical protein